MILVVPNNYVAQNKMVGESGSEATCDIDQNANLVSNAKSKRNKHGLRISTASESSQIHANEMHQNSKTANPKPVSVFIKLSFNNILFSLIVKYPPSIKILNAVIAFAVVVLFIKYDSGQIRLVFVILFKFIPRRKK